MWNEIASGEKHITILYFIVLDLFMFPNDGVFSSSGKD